MSKARALWILCLIGSAALPSLAAAQVPTSHSIALRSGAIDTAKLLLQEEAADSSGDGRGEVVIVQFPGPVTAEQVRALRAAGARIYTYLPYDAYLVRMPPGMDKARLAAAAGASWSGKYQPFSKILPAVAGVSPDKGTGLRQVMVQVYPDADLEAVVEAIRGLGGTAPLRIAGAGRNPYFSRVRLLLSSEEIAEVRESLAALPDVFWIDLEGRKVLRNDNTVWVGQSGASGDRSTPIFDHGIFGQGQIVAVLDSGIDADACWFRDPGRGLPPTNVCNGGTTVDTSRRKVIAVDFLDAGECVNGITATEWDTHGHGTHVAGTLTGDDFARPLLHDAADGMAPGAKLVVQDGGARTDNCADIPALGCPVIDLNPIFQQTYDQGARIHSDSWGDDENNPSQNHYTAATQDVDEFVWNHKDFLIFIAAGNDGPRERSVGSPSTAKSCVSVGATEPGRFAEAMAVFSSCGPTDDGRLKPDLTVPGQEIVSAANDGSVASEDCSTLGANGTSMAAPAAAGFAALIRQYFADGWYPSGAARAEDRFLPSAALVKATLLSSAVDMAQASPIPDACQGWGRVLLANALLFAGDTRHLWVADDAGFATGAAGASRSFSFDVGSGAPLKATLVWTDFPSTPAASVQLVNDLDLTLTGPGGESWLGNVFTGGRSATGGAADRRNTVEQALLDNPAPGRYTVTVQAANVPQGPQPFALVVTGEATAIAIAPGGAVFFDDFETDQGWTVNPDGTDTAVPASAGAWERGVPQVVRSGGVKQLGKTVSGTRDLVTGRAKGRTADAFDLDGVTSIESPAISLPSPGTSAGKLTLSFSYYFAHARGSSGADFFQVRVIGAAGAKTVFREAGTARNDNAVWARATADLTPFAGQTVRLRIEAADAAAPNLVEAAVDDVRIAREP